MVSNKISWLALAVMFEIAVCSLAVSIMHVSDKQQEDASSSIQKRSLKSGGSEINLNFQHGMRDIIFNGEAVGIVGVKGIPAFFATLTSGDIGPNYAHDAIKFNDVSINIANGYNPVNGKFTAPLDDGSMYTQLHANHKNYDQLSKTVLMQLKKGQEVWVRLHNGSSYAVYGRERYTTFGGYLISF